MAVRAILTSFLATTFVFTSLGASGQSQIHTPHFPPRSEKALGGHELALLLAKLSPKDREERIYREVADGNVPDSERVFVPVPLTAEIDGATVKATIYVIPDYLAIGTDADHLYVPLTPYTAQRIADYYHCSLPTPKMVDAVYQAATVKLAPSPIPPSPAMTTVPVFWDHTEMVDKQRRAVLTEHGYGELVAGDKKDIVICLALAFPDKNVAIYGWHKLDGQPIQPVYTKHLSSWADYSHGIRLILNEVSINGRQSSVQEVLADPKLAKVLSYEGVIPNPRYTMITFPSDPQKGLR
jgi:hypothetical protein